MNTISTTGATGMTAEEFRIFRDYIYRRSGLYFEESKKFFLEKKLAERLVALGIDSFSRYFMHLHQENEPVEVKEIFRHITTTETGFYRNRRQMDGLRRRLLQDVVARVQKRGDRLLRVWSAGCSTGEECYTVAMLIRQHLDAANLDLQAEVIGSDINEQALKEARLGLYGEERCAPLPDELRHGFMDQVPGGFQVKGDIRQSVRFSYFNLADTFRYLSMGKMDMVLCRNVMIYFGEAARKEVLDSMARVIRPGGLLFLGYSEHIPKPGPFEPVVRDGRTVCYRKVNES